jgi:preprotein translocase subunit SecA
MLGYIARKLFGTRNDRILRSLDPLVVRVNELEKTYAAMSNETLQAQTGVLKERIAKGEHLDSVMAEAFAVTREASRRVLNMRHFDVQLVGGAVLHSGKISEMRTGEGKTLVATLPAYLNALSGKGVHVVTVNDYLARRDAEWMGRLYNFLGMSVGVVLPHQDDITKRQAYRADITYGQNNEFGFDYLRDNMKFSADEMAQRGHNFAIVDEVDSILIDEARTPLIISGAAEDSSDLYYKVNSIIPNLKIEQDFTIDLRSKQPTMTEEGIAKCEQLLNVKNLYDPNNIQLVHHVSQALVAHATKQRDVDYVVENGQVVIVDEFTGRKMQGRVWSNGLHQAIEAKEGLQIKRENQTLATITFQNYFRLYSKLSGMTGTADTEAAEFKKIYNLEVVVVPTNKEMIRADESDQVYRTRREKYEAVAKALVETNATGQPILVGTVSIEQSELLSSILSSRGIKHNVLNAKQHEREAEIVAQAGKLGGVTIATNMAGRGTDIILGGNPSFLATQETGSKDLKDPAFQEALARHQKACGEEQEKVKELGGLFIIGTERHESRRIDNQLRGRAGRQGDPGRSRFYVSLEDDLMARFGGEKMRSLMQKLGWEEGMPLDGSMISNSIRRAQQRVEAMHFEERKHLLDFDDVLNKQRQVVYNLRHRVLFGDSSREAPTMLAPNASSREEIFDYIDDVLEETVTSRCEDDRRPFEWDLKGIEERFLFLFKAPFSFPKDFELNRQKIFDLVRDEARKLYSSRMQDAEQKLIALEDVYSKAFDGVDSESFKIAGVERDIILSTLDQMWLQHLQEMDTLREGIGLRGYGQKNPLHEYQRDGFLIFQQMLVGLKENVVRKLFYYEVRDAREVLAEIEAEQKRRAALERSMNAMHQSVLSDSGESIDTAAEAAAARAKINAQRKLRRKLGK